VGVGWEKDDHADRIRAGDRRGLESRVRPSYNLPRIQAASSGQAPEITMGVKKTGKGRRKLGQKKRRMRARIRHRKG
jgi:hypothetical protein